MGITTQNRTFRSNQFVFFDTFGSPFFYPYGYYYPYYGYYYPYDYSYYSGPAYDYDAVAAVQRRLAELGYYDDMIDGFMGPRTRGAITAYESTHNLVVDGTIQRAASPQNGPRLIRDLIVGLSVD